MPNLDDVFVPQFSLEIAEMQDGSEMMMLKIETASTSYSCALATKLNYRQVADVLKDNIIQVGDQMKSTLVTGLKGLPDGLSSKKRR